MVARSAARTSTTVAVPARTAAAGLTRQVGVGSS